MYLDVTYISAITGSALFSRRQPLLIDAGGEDQRFPWEPLLEDRSIGASGRPQPRRAACPGARRDAPGGH